MFLYRIRDLIRYTSEYNNVYVDRCQWASSDPVSITARDWKVYGFVALWTFLWKTSVTCSLSSLFFATNHDQGWSLNEVYGWELRTCLLTFLGLPIGLVVRKY
jgi:hypothetical protein